MTSRVRGRSARSRLALARVAAAAGAALALAGCGAAPQAGAAAVVGDSRIRVTDLQTATSQINEATGQDGAIASATVLGWMMVAPFVLAAAADSDAVASEGDACLVLQGAAAQTEGQEEPDEGACTSGAIDDYATATLLAVRSYLSAGNTAQELQDLQAVGEWWNGILDEVEADGVDVNPRFGQYTRTDAGEVQNLDGLLAIVGPASQNWIVTPSPSPSLPAVPEQSPSPSPTPSPTPTQ